MAVEQIPDGGPERSIFSIHESWTSVRPVSLSASTARVPNGWFHRAVRGCGIPLLLAGTLLPGTASSQAPEMLENVVVIGQRAPGIDPLSSPTPVEIIGGTALEAYGGESTESNLARTLPSYNLNREPISDEASVVRPALLRGLPPDSVLVLVNGKRRHRSSVITVSSATAPGSHGPDLAAIPGIAIERIEVLRDAASAQYGSDAVAGVLNFVLKQRPDTQVAEARWGRTYAGDGDRWTLAGHAGVPLADQGFVALSLERSHQAPSTRSVQHASARQLAAAGNPWINDPGYGYIDHPYAQTWGTPEGRGDWKTMVNAGLPLGTSTEIYGFGNWHRRTVENGFFFRNPARRGGVFSLGDEVLLADLSADPTAVRCQSGLTPDSGDWSGHVAAIRRFVEDNPNCYWIGTQFPGGFTPRFGGDVEDVSYHAGVRGTLPNDAPLLSGWDWDLSAGMGQHSVDFFMERTINPQLLALGRELPTSYRVGGWSERDWIVEGSVVGRLDVGAAWPLTVALGTEVRNERFEVVAGDFNSTFVDTRPGGLREQGFGIGTNGFPGFQERTAGAASRTAQGAWLDLSTDLSEELLVHGALRHERHESIGSNTDGKVAARYDLSDEIALRASVGSAFRAPTVGQASIEKVITQFVPDLGDLIDIATLSVDNPIAILKGAKPLTPETARSVNAGVVARLAGFTVTLDGYQIRMKDRIAVTSEFDLSEGDKAALREQGIADADAYARVKFLTNDFGTTTQGVDVSAERLIAHGNDSATRLHAVLNWNRTRVDGTSTLLNAGETLAAERGVPRWRGVLGASHERGQLTLSGRLRLYGPFTNVYYTSDLSSAREVGTHALFDAEVALRITDGLTLAIGAENLFDTYPPRTDARDGETVGLPYLRRSPFGFDGGYYYARLRWER
jgi:iron complex outermembrane receptor protein